MIKAFDDFQQVTGSQVEQVGFVEPPAQHHDFAGNLCLVVAD